MQNDFYRTELPEPHIERRKQILKAHPEVKNLYGTDPMLAVYTILLIALQLALSLIVPTLGLGWYLLIAYFVGATITHALFLAIHEITHYLAFKNRPLNNWLAMAANIPIVFPYAMSFQYYHFKHHWNQGKEGIDTDLPTEFEAKTFKGKLGKFIWAFNQILFYAIRPVIVHPIKLNKWQIINIIVQIAVMAVFIYFAGWAAIIYLLVSAFMAGSLHPTAGHFIAEHYVFKQGQETYSYYGPLNKLTFNVGYHNEHHDFPAIPGSRLYNLRKIAPEYYESLYYHTSWVKVIWKFITDKNITLYSRTKRI